MKKVFLLIVLLIYSSDAIAQNNNVDAKGWRQGEWVIKDKSGSIIMCVYVNDTLQGDWIKYFSSGQIEERCHYINGKLHGPHQAYYQRGHLLQVEDEYDHNVLVGIRKLYDIDGKLWQTFEFENGWPNRKWTVFAKEKKVAETSFVNGFIHGTYVEYYPAGSIRLMCEFHQGSIVESAKTYDKKGHLILIQYSNEAGDRFIRQEKFDRKGNLSATQSIDKKPFTYLMFGQEVHRKKDTERGELNNHN